MFINRRLVVNTILRNITRKDLNSWYRFEPNFYRNEERQMHHVSGTVLKGLLVVPNPCYQLSGKRNVANDSTTVIHSLYCDTRPVLFFQELYQNIHDFTGFSWWSSIIISVTGLRLVTTFPLAVYQHYILAKYANLGPELNEIAKELMKETAVAARMYKLNQAKARHLFNVNMKRQRTKLIIRDNCHPFKASLLVFVQIPMWFSQSLSLRNMVYMLPVQTTAAQLTYLNLSVGGTLWFTNLTYPDQTFLLPLLLGLVNMSIIEFHALRRSGPPTRFQRWTTNCFRVLTVVMVPVAASVPSCLALAWVTSSVFGLFQNIVLLLPKVRRFCRIPQTAHDSATPLKDVLQNLKLKLSAAKK